MEGVVYIHSLLFLIIPHEMEKSQKATSTRHSSLFTNSGIKSMSHYFGSFTYGAQMREQSTTGEWDSTQQNSTELRLANNA